MRQATAPSPRGSSTPGAAEPGAHVPAGVEAERRQPCPPSGASCAATASAGDVRRNTVAAQASPAEARGAPGRSAVRRATVPPSGHGWRSSRVPAAARARRRPRRSSLRARPRAPRRARVSRSLVSCVPLGIRAGSAPVSAVSRRAWCHGRQRADRALRHRTGAAARRARGRDRARRAAPARPMRGDPTRRARSPGSRETWLCGDRASARRTVSGGRTAHAARPPASVPPVLLRFLLRVGDRFLRDLDLLQLALARPSTARDAGLIRDFSL